VTNSTSESRAGEAAYAEKRLPDAIDNLRIAAFGLLESPPLEAEALAYLALAQSASGRATDTDATLGRFLEVERRFAPYAKLKLDPAVRADFQALLLRRVSQPTLLAYPGLAVLVETEEQKIAKLPPKERTKAYEAAARREPGSMRWPLALARDAEAAGDTRRRSHGRARPSDRARQRRRARSGPRLLLPGRLRGRPGRPFDAPGGRDRGPAGAARRSVRLSRGTEGVGSASDAAKTLPSAQAARPDVVRAQQQLAAQQPQAAR
jgi:hypothetical protein